jgi:hypothetical protein
MYGAFGLPRTAEDEWFSMKMMTKGGFPLADETGSRKSGIIPSTAAMTRFRPPPPSAPINAL